MWSYFSKQAEKLGRDDEDRLLKNKKLVLLVDLDQTLIHTTNDDVPQELPVFYNFFLFVFDTFTYCIVWSFSCFLFKKVINCICVIGCTTFPTLWNKFSLVSYKVASWNSNLFREHLQILWAPHLYIWGQTLCA